MLSPSQQHWGGCGGTVCQGCGKGMAGSRQGQQKLLPAGGTGWPRGSLAAGPTPVEPGQPRHSDCGFPALATTLGILCWDGGLGALLGEALSIIEHWRPYNNNRLSWCHQRTEPGTEMLPESHSSSRQD